LNPAAGVPGGAQIALRGENAVTIVFASSNSTVIVLSGNSAPGLAPGVADPLSGSADGFRLDAIGGDVFEVNVVDYVSIALGLFG
jgi:hypothetical protein